MSLFGGKKGETNTEFSGKKNIFFKQSDNENMSSRKFVEHITVYIYYMA